jgi:Ca2+-binding EF-hand superfamily protein
MPPLIRVLDADGNGQLSADEIANASTALKSLDRDGDGILQPREWFPRPPMGDGPGRPGAGEGGRDRRGLAGLDKDGDGIVSKSEVPENMTRFFELADTNKDGKVDGSEMANVTTPRGGPGPGRPGPLGALQDWASLDANKDGKLQREEAPERMVAMFDRIDTNGDGAVDREEGRVFREKMRERAERRPDRPERPGQKKPKGDAD